MNELIFFFSEKKNCKREKKKNKMILFEFVWDFRHFKRLNHLTSFIGTLVDNFIKLVSFDFPPFFFLLCKRKKKFIAYREKIAVITFMIAYKSFEIKFVLTQVWYRSNRTRKGLRHLIYFVERNVEDACKLHRSCSRSCSFDKVH